MRQGTEGVEQAPGIVLVPRAGQGLGAGRDHGAGWGLGAGRGLGQGGAMGWTGYTTAGGGCGGAGRVRRSVLILNLQVLV